MSSLAHQLCGLRSSPLSSTPISTRKRFSPVVSAAASPTPISNAQTKERLKLKQLFKEAYERCCITPMDGVSFTLEDFHDALANYDFVSELGTKVNLLFQFLSSSFRYLLFLVVDNFLFDFQNCALSILVHSSITLAEIIAL